MKSGRYFYLVVIRTVLDGDYAALASSQSFQQEESIREHLESARQRVKEMGDPRDQEVSCPAARPGSTTTTAGEGFGRSSETGTTKAQLRQ